MNFFRKLLIPSGKKEEVTVLENWSVRWSSRNGSFSNNTKKEAEFFTNEEEAKKFAKALEDAFKLVRNTSENSVKIVKTTNQ